jgi:hypothetical protein
MESKAPKKAENKMGVHNTTFSSTWAKMAGAPPGIRTGYFPIERLEHYSLSELTCSVTVFLRRTSSQFSVYQ